MTELEKIEYTKSFIDKLAEGIDPTDGTVIPEGDVIRKPRLVGCLKYVSELFSKVIENPEAAEAIYKCEDWTVTPDVILKIQCYSEHVSISALAKRIDEALCSTRKFTAAEIHNWLIEKGYLTRDKLNTGRTTRNPTQRGLAIGILTDDVPAENGVVKHYVWCDHRVQVFIKNHLEDIITFANSGKRAKWGSRGKYIAVTYDMTAQKFIVDNIHAIISVV